MTSSAVRPTKLERVGHDAGTGGMGMLSGEYLEVMLLVFVCAVAALVIGTVTASNKRSKS